VQNLALGQYNGFDVLAHSKHTAVFAWANFDSGGIDGSLEEVLDGTNCSAAALCNLGVR
jgi:hypothetical protein